MAKTKRSMIALGALILGAFSIVIGWIPIIGWTIVLLSIIFGIIGIKETKDHPDRWMAITGLVLGVLSVVIMVLTLVAFVMITSTTTQSDDLSGPTAPARDEQAAREEMVVEEPIRVIEIEGSGVDRTIETDEPVEIVVSGSNNKIRITEGAVVASLWIEGYNNTIVLASDVIVHEMNDVGMNNGIARESH